MAGPDELMRAMVRTLPGVVYRCEVDEHWTMQLISDEIEQLTGYPAAAFVGNAERSYAGIIHDDDRARVAREVAAALEHGSTFVVEYRLVRADGDVVWVLERGRLVEPGPGEAALDGLLFDITDRKRAQSELRAAMAEQAAAQAVAEERIRIARDLHDSVGHALSVIALQAGAATAHLPKGADTAAQAVAAIRTVAADTLEDMDRLLQLLHDDADSPPAVRGLTDVDTLVERVHAAGIPVELGLDGRPLPLTEDVDALAYRVVQEGLTNALKHAPGADVTVNIRHRDDTVTIEVVNGAALAGANTRRWGGRGLAGLRSRVEGIGGELVAAPGQAGGFVLRAVLPRTPACASAPPVTAPAAPGPRTVPG